MQQRFEVQQQKQGYPAHVVGFVAQLMQLVSVKNQFSCKTSYCLSFYIVSPNFCYSSSPILIGFSPI